MKSINLDRFYHKINKHVLLTESYTEIKNLSFIIKSCRLKPKSILVNHNYDLVLHNYWVDEFNNSLTIKNKKIKVSYNNLDFLFPVSTTDLYYGLSLDKIYKISKLLYIYSAKIEGTYDNFLLVSFLGIDNYWRTYYVYDGEISNCSPLILGFNTLREISDNLDVKYFIDIQSKNNNIIVPCYDKKAWLIYCPMHQDFISELKIHSEFAADFLTQQIIKGKNIDV